MILRADAAEQLPCCGPDARYIESGSSYPFPSLTFRHTQRTDRLRRYLLTTAAAPTATICTSQTVQNLTAGSDYGVAHPGRDPFAHNYCRQHHQNDQRHLRPGKHVQAGLKLRADSASADQPSMALSRMLISQRKTLMPKKVGSTCGTIA